MRRATLSRASLLIGILVVAPSCSRSPLRPRAGDRALETAIAEVEAGRRTTPLIAQTSGGDSRVTFLVKGDGAQTPRIVSDVTGWGEDPIANTFDLTIGTMSPVDSTDWYALETQVAPGARIEYMVVRGQTDYRADPHNPRRAELRADATSEFVTPGYQPPRELLGPPVAPSGRTTDATIESRALGGPRRLIVYTPPGYRNDGSYPVALFHNGTNVVQTGQAPRVLDSLIAHRAIEPLVAVFVESHVYGDPDNHEGEPMRAFLTREVPRWIRARYGVAARSEAWAILAISYGAKDALDAALAPEGAYGSLGLLIPGRRIRRPDLEAIATRRDRRLRVAILAGRYDGSNLPTARAARQALADAGHTVEYIEVPEGHSPVTWRNHLRDVVVSLFGTGHRQR